MKRIIGAAVTVLALMCVLTACGKAEPAAAEVTVAATTTTAAATTTTTAATTTEAQTADTEEADYSDSESEISDLVGWWYIPADHEGFPIISIFEVKDDGTFIAYDTLKNPDLEGSVTVSGDVFAMDVPFFGLIELYYQDGALYDEEGGLAFERGDELEAPDNSFIYGTWYLGGDPSADSLTLSEDGTYDDYDSYIEMSDTGIFELDYEINMINGMDMMDGEPSTYIRLGTEDDFFPKEYYIMPGGNTIYIDDGWGGVSVYAKEDVDAEAFEYDSKLLLLTNHESNWSNDDYSLIFYKNGYFSIDKIETTENSYSSSYYMHGTYEVNDDFTSVYLSFDDGSFDGDCPLDLENGTISAPPLGELS
jgi:hypothetical protein